MTAQMRRTGGIGSNSSDQIISKDKIEEEKRYVCLTLKDLVWIHNYIIKQMVSVKRDA